MRTKLILFLVAFLFSLNQFSYAKEWAEYPSADRAVDPEQLECDDIILVITDETASNSFAGQRWENARHVELRKFHPCLFTVAEVSAAQTLIVFENLPIDVTSGALTFPQPVTPAPGDVFGVFDSRGNAATNNITIDFTDPFQGTVEDYVIRVDRGSAVFEYVNASIGWRLLSYNGALAVETITDTTNFNNVLSGTDTTTQIALDTLDNSIGSVILACDSTQFLAGQSNYLCIGADGILRTKAGAAPTADTDARIIGPHAVETVSAVKTLVANDCGKTIFLSDATEFATTLPVPTAGCTFKFIIAAAPSGASYTVVTDAGADVLIGGINELEVDTSDDGPYTATGDTITFVDSVSVVGDYVDMVSDGTSWYISGQTNADGGVTLTNT